MSANVEQDRLAGDGRAWKRWGPYLSERSWGTVREDYSADGDAWDYLPHDHARSRAYRWNEDGLAGLSDDQQRLCFALSFWNGADPILKERIFGLTGNEGNHGEDAKELWWYLDSTPTHSWMRWAYLYPQDEFPYERLLTENQRRGRLEPELELLDTGIFDDDRYWDVVADYAKASPDDVCIRIRVRNAGPKEATLDVLPTVWFRNTWSWGLDDRKPVLVDKGGALVAEHHSLGRMVLVGEGAPELLFCENESNAQRLWGTEAIAFPKDGIADHVVHGAATVNPDRTGTKAALRYRITVAAGETAELRLRLSSDGAAVNGEWDDVMAAREHEADEFYAALTPSDAGADEARGPAPGPGRDAVDQAVLPLRRRPVAGRRPCAATAARGAHAGAQPRVAPPEQRRRHLDAGQVGVPVVRGVGPRVPLRAPRPGRPAVRQGSAPPAVPEWYMHPNGQLPAYEWSFSDVNPPVHAWAALRVFELDGRRDYDFLGRIFQKLLLNFTWWVNRKDADGNNVFEGGFLGLDNIGPIDRSAQLPVDGRLAQADGTAWMAMYCLNLLEIALVLADHDRLYEDMATKFLEHFAYIATRAARRSGTRRTASTTTCCTWPTADGCRCGSGRWSASFPWRPRRPSAAADAGSPPRVRRAVALVHEQQARVRGEHRPHPRAGRGRRTSALGRAARAAAPRPRRHAGRGRVPLRPRAAGPVRAPS